MNERVRKIWQGSMFHFGSLAVITAVWLILMGSILVSLSRPQAIAPAIQEALTHRDDEEPAADPVASAAAADQRR